MIKTDEDLLVCDLAETYHIYDYKQLPPLTVAAFSYGLRADSRINLKLNNQPVDIDTQMLAGIFDVVNLMWWSRTKDGQSNKNRPKSILNSIMSSSKDDQQRDEVTFDSGEDFERARRNLLLGGEN